MGWRSGWTLLHETRDIVPLTKNSKEQDVRTT